MIILNFFKIDFSPCGFKKNRFTSGGFSFIDAIIGIAILTISFLAIYGVFNLSIGLIGVSKAKVGALSLATERMELTHNLSYDDVGTLGGIVPGSIPQEESISLNGVNYTRRVSVVYIDDPQDGLLSGDENGINNDYKRVRVEVSWESKRETDPVVLVSDIMPKGIETNIGGGTLIINVLDALVSPVAFAEIHIENSSTSPAVSTDVFTNENGKVIFPGVPATGNYKITVSKGGYSESKTYDADINNPNPDPGHLTILEGEVTEVTFVIDKLSDKNVKTFAPVGEYIWPDPFDDYSKVATSSDVAIDDGKLSLSYSTSTGYSLSGSVFSRDIGPADLFSWEELSWSDSSSASTTLKYRLYYFNGPDLEKIPDLDLPGNSVGFLSSPVDLSSLDIATYPNISIFGELSSIDASSTPELFDWQIKYEAGPIPIPVIDFHMRGEKIIGKDALDESIYKYSKDLRTNDGGQLQVDDLEFDIYNITIDGVATGYDISESRNPQPLNLLPGSTVETVLILVPHAQNTLLVTVKNSSGLLIEGAMVRLYKAGYDEAQETSAWGQTFFTPLSASTVYSLEVTKAGYLNFNLNNVDVVGQSNIDILMN